MKDAVVAGGDVGPVSYTHLDVYKRQGHGSSFPWLSNSTGRPAMEGAFTVETTSKDCCPKTTVTVNSKPINRLADLVTFVISHHQEHCNDYDHSSSHSRRCQSFAKQESGQRYSKHRNKVERSGGRRYVKMLERLEK